MEKTLVVQNCVLKSKPSSSTLRTVQLSEQLKHRGKKVRSDSEQVLADIKADAWPNLMEAAILKLTQSGR
jgi:hypothetical protein